MKKTLTALVFALCASFAFAQTNNVVVKKGVVQNGVAAPTKVKVETSDAVREGSYKGSIFTKNVGDTLASFTFAAMPTTGTLSANDILNGRDTVKNGAHAQSGRGATWNRIENVAVSNYENDYPVSANNSFANSVNFGACYSNSVDDGWMFMAMQEQIAAWGGTGTVGAYNAYFKVDSIRTTGAATVELVMYQRYRCFNQDQCWIDYSTDGSNWNCFEINVNGVDVTTNNSIHAWSRFALPLACSNQADLQVRIRWSCVADGNGGGAYGYFWVVDDMYFLEGPDNHIKMVSNDYFEGFYHQIPQGMNLPLIWNAEFVNTGAQTQTNVEGHLYAKETRTAEPVELVSTAALASVEYRADTFARIDPTGWLTYGGFGYMLDGSPVETTGANTFAHLPTENAGRHYFYSDLTSDQWEHMYKVKDTTVDEGYRFEPADEAMYQVNPLVDNQAVWSRDNGMLTGNNYWLYGTINADGVYTSDIESEGFIGWKNTDYMVTTMFVTGDTLPTDENGNPWVIKGVEYVPATHTQACAPDAVFDPVLILDSNYYDGTSMFIAFGWIETGANSYVTTEEDLNDNIELWSTNRGGDEGEYNTIRIMFPAQPELKAKRNYHLGYQIIEDGSLFSCAAANRAGFVDEQGEAHYFYQTEGLEDYGITAPLVNRYSNLIYDKTYTQDGWHWYGWDEYPMIRMIVGPYEELPKSFVSFTCENLGPNSMVYDNNDNALCGETIELPANATYNFTADPRDPEDSEDKWFVDEIWINGTQEFKNDTTNNFENFYYRGVSFSVATGEEGTQNTVEVKYVHYDISANEAYYNTKMSLYPNPATSNARLTIEGVEGMVELSLIDMSGRVIRTSKVNAEQEQVIDLNGLAKGAYFVRVTNANMTKVEKLIVR